VVSDPTAAENPFFRMIPEGIYWPVLALTTTATVIASQAVISGGFSVTQAAVQLGLLPRIQDVGPEEREDSTGEGDARLAGRMSLPPTLCSDAR
jgi:KUP system potassium uptake protein